MKTFGIIIWVLFALYSALCIWVPDMRVISWKGTDKQLGGVSYVGLTIAFWSPALIVTGLVPESLGVVIYLLVSIGFLLAVIGFVIDSV